MPVAVAALRPESGMFIALQQMQANRFLPPSKHEGYMPSKLDLVLIAGSIAAVMGWIERGHSVVIDSPDPIELASLAPAPACPADDSIRYGMSQMVFSGDGFVSGAPERQNLPEAGSPACDTKLIELSAR
jgi:hypothetical protein